MMEKTRTMKLNKWFAVFIFGIFVLSGISMVMIVHTQMRKQALIEAKIKSMIRLDQNLAIHTYFSHKLKPKLFKWSEPFRTEEYFEPSWMSSTYAVREIEKYFQSFNEESFYYKECAIDARSPENEATLYEKLFLERLNKDSKLVHENKIRIVDGKPFYIILRRGELMEQSCLRCHSDPNEAPKGMTDIYGSERSFHRSVGDVAQAISIRIPLSNAYASMDEFSHRLSFILVGVLALLSVTVFFFSRQFIFRPIKRVRDMSQKIISGSDHFGEKIPLPYWHELRDLTTAFNNMSETTFHTFHNLEELVRERTSELEKANADLEIQIEERKQAEEALQKSYDEMERQVEERTAELAKTNKQLKKEIVRGKQSEKLLRKKDKGLSEAQRIAHLGNWDWNIVTNELSWSDEIYRIFGLMPQEFGITYDSFLNHVHPEDREPVENAVKKALADPEMKYSIEHRVVLPDGSERTVHERGEATFGDNGKPVRMIGTVQDVTEQKLAEKAQQEAELNYRTVADFTYDWEYWVDVDGTPRYVSPSCERISGYKVFQFMENPLLFQEIIIPEDRGLWDKHHQDARRNLKLREIQFRIRRRDGQTCWIEHACRPVTDDRGTPLGFRASNRDITERKQAELELQNAISKIKLLKEKLELESDYLQQEIKLEHDFEHIVGNGDALKYVLFKVEQVASSDTSVIILGETGTGKELVARALHSSSSRKDRPLIKVNCATLPSNLIESELFGHEKGAFTGSHARQVGRFEIADGATIFLDEIGEMPLELQAKLLRVLQDGEFERLGNPRTFKVNVRVIAATNRNLEKEVRNGRFRQDLWYRLKVFPITIPPLRDRKEDIPLLVEHFVNSSCKRLGKSIETISQGTIKVLQNYPWPGNVRELEHVIERAVINSSGPKLHLSDNLEQSEFVDLAKKPRKSLEEMERDYIVQILEETNWRVDGPKGSALILSLNPSTLRARMRKLGIKKPSF